MPAGNRNLRICKNGHRYYKSSDCPVCQACEAERKSPECFAKNLTVHARRALEGKGIKNLHQILRSAKRKFYNFMGWAIAR